MESTRRGFFGMLAGAVVAPKIIGPRRLADPTPDAWRAVRRLPCAIRELRPNQTYLPLEVFANEALKVVHRELAFLRRCGMQQDYSEYYRTGDTLMFRNYEVPFSGFGSARNGGKTIDDIGMVSRMVNVSNFANAILDLRDLDIDAPWEKISSHYVEPVGQQLAEGVIGAVRRCGGGERLITVAPSIPSGVDRCLITADHQAGLVLRAVQDRGLPDLCRPILRLDMVFALG